MTQNLKQHTILTNIRYSLFGKDAKYDRVGHILLDFNPSKPLAIKNKQAHNNTHIKIQSKKGQILC